ADYYFEYDGLGNQGLSMTYPVTKAVVQGAGCSACTAGQGTFSFTYATNPNLPQNPGYNDWDVKTIESLPDHDPTNPTNPITSQNIVYTNAFGQVMLKVYKRQEPGWAEAKEWKTYYHYDAAARVDKMAHPSAVTGYDETLLGLVNPATHLNNTG